MVHTDESYTLCEENRGIFAPGKDPGLSRIVQITPPEQVGFRAKRCAEEHMTRLAQNMMGASEETKNGAHGSCLHRFDCRL